MPSRQPYKNRFAALCDRPRRGLVHLDSKQSRVAIDAQFNQRLHTARWWHPDPERLAVTCSQYVTRPGIQASELTAVHSSRPSSNNLAPKPHLRRIAGISPCFVVFQGAGVKVHGQGAFSLISASIRVEAYVRINERKNTAMHSDGHRT